MFMTKLLFTGAKVLFVGISALLGGKFQVPRMIDENEKI